jgi:hypothetical protein
LAHRTPPTGQCLRQLVNSVRQLANASATWSIVPVTWASSRAAPGHRRRYTSTGVRGYMWGIYIVGRWCILPDEIYISAVRLPANWRVGSRDPVVPGRRSRPERLGSAPPTRAIQCPRGRARLPPRPSPRAARQLPPANWRIRPRRDPGRIRPGPPAPPIIPRPPGRDRRAGGRTPGWDTRA